MTTDFTVLQKRTTKQNFLILFSNKIIGGGENCMVIPTKFMILKQHKKRQMINSASLSSSTLIEKFGFYDSKKNKNLSNLTQLGCLINVLDRKYHTNFDP